MFADQPNDALEIHTDARRRRVADHATHASQCYCLDNSAECCRPACWCHNGRWLTTPRPGPMDWMGSYPLPPLTVQELAALRKIVCLLTQGAAADHLDDPVGLLAEARDLLPDSLIGWAAQ